MIATYKARRASKERFVNLLALRALGETTQVELAYDALAGACADAMSVVSSNAECTRSAS